MLKFLSSIWNRVRSFFRRILNYGNHNNAEHKNTHSTNTFKTDNSNIGKNMNNGQLPIHEAIEQNHWKEALELINQALPDELNATNELGQTPLHLAVAAKDLNNKWIYETGGHGTNVLMSIINALIERGASVNAQDKDGEAPVHYISKWLLVDKNNGKVKSELVNDGGYIYDNVLMLALQCLIKNRIDINIEDKEGNTALDNIIKAKWFSTKGFYGGQSALSVIKTLLDAGAHIKDQEQALKIFAGSIAYSDVIGPNSQNYKEGDDIKIRDLIISNGITLVEKDGTKVKREIDINYKDKKGNTALSLAYEKKKRDVIKFLIKKGADPKTIIPSTKKSFMTHVIEDNLFDLVPSLKFDAVLINGLPPIVTAMNSGNYDSFLTLIKKHKADISFSNGYGKKAIHYAAAGGSTKILEYLINHGADVNSFDNFGDTALHHVAIDKDGNENIAFLIQNGIDVNCQNKDGIRPILFAIENNHLANLQILLDNGASLEIKDFEGVEKIDPSIVVALLRSKNYSVVQDLLESKRTNLDEILKVSAHERNNDNYTILHWAAVNNRPDIFAALELYIKDVHINDKGRVGHTPLHFAVHNNNVDVVKILLKIPDIDINASLGSNYLPNSSIGCARNAKMVFMLIEAGADIESEQGKRDLAGVINRLIEEGKNEEIITLLSHALLKDKIDFNIEAWHRGHDGITILRAAASEHNTKLMILLILLFNADLTLTDKHGKKPLDYLSDPELKKYLEEDVVELRDNINEICGTSATDFILPYLKDSSDISTTLKSLNQLVENVTELDNVVNENIEKYTFKLFEKRKWKSFKENPDTKIALLNVNTLKEVFKYLSDIDKKNFFLSIVSDQANDYLQFLSNLRSWLSKKERNKSIDDCIKDLSDNFDQLMDEYIHDFGSRAKISDSKDIPSTSFDTAKVEKKGKQLCN